MGIYKNLRKPSFWARTGAAVCAAALLIIPSDNLMSKNASGSSSMQNIQDQISQIQKENEEAMCGFNSQSPVSLSIKKIRSIELSDFISES